MSPKDLVELINEIIDDGVVEAIVKLRVKQFDAYLDAGFSRNEAISLLIEDNQHKWMVK